MCGFPSDLPERDLGDGDLPKGDLPEPRDGGSGRPRSTVGRRVVSRRAALAAGAVVAAAGAGAAAGHRRPVSEAPQDPRPAAPDWLTAARTRERTLLAVLGGAPTSADQTSALLDVIRADHAAHLRALDGMTSRFRPTPSPSSLAVRSSDASAPAVPLPSQAALGAAEAAAAAEGARVAINLPGPDAAVIASIAACEAAHAELLR